MRMCLIAGIIILILVIVIPAGKSLSRIRCWGHDRLCKSADIAGISCRYSPLIGFHLQIPQRPRFRLMVYNTTAARSLGLSYDYDRTMMG